MTVSLFAMLAGLFVMPALLLAGGHRLRRRSPKFRSAFWGAIVAHVMAAAVACVASMWPPEEWQSGQLWRGAIGFWSLLIAPLIGAGIGFVSSGRSRQR